MLPDLRWKIATILLGAALLLIVAAAFVYLRFTNPSIQRVSTAFVVAQIKPLKQLVTVRYTIQQVVGLTEQKLPLGEESLLLMVQGQALAGVDLESLRPDDLMLGTSREIVISLPPPQVLEAFLDEKQTKVWDHRITWWTPWVPYDPDLEHRARLSAVDGLRSAAIRMGILNEAKRNAESAIRDFLSAFQIRATFKPRST